MKKTFIPSKTRIHRGDTVRVLLGKDRGKKAVVLAMLPAQGRAIVEGVNMVKKHVKARKQGEKGQRVNVAAPMTLSNLQLVCPSCKKGTRVQIIREASGTQRVCKKCNSPIPVVTKKQ